MCGRFALKNTAGLQLLFDSLDVKVPDVETRYNIAPGTAIPGLLNDFHFRTDIIWGIEPVWAKKKPALIINARAETIREKPTFRNLFKSQRMIIPVSGFYEWKREGNAKIPYYFFGKDDLPLALAGIYSINRDNVVQCCIITTEAGEAMRTIHDRQPLVIERNLMHDWLKSEDSAVLDAIMALNDGLGSYQVSSFVNSSRNEGPECLEKIK